MCPAGISLSQGLTVGEDYFPGSVLAVNAADKTAGQQAFGACL